MAKCAVPGGGPWAAAGLLAAGSALGLVIVLLATYRGPSTAFQLRREAVTGATESGGRLASKLPPPGTWTWSFNVSRPGLEGCVRRISATPFWQSVAEQYSNLPKLGIVIATEHGAVRLAGLSHMETYAFRHGYGFHSPLIHTPDWDTTDDGAHIHHFFSARWHHLQKRLLGSYQWLLMLDGDVFALNMHNLLDQWLDVPEDVILHVRTDYEIGSGAVLVRSTPFGYCFLEEWIRRGTVLETTQHNWDNGDLIDVVMDLVEPPMPECKSFRSHSYRHGYMQCFREKYDRLLDLPQHLPVRVLMPMTGFWRDWVGDTPQEGGPVVNSALYTALYRKCAWPSDVFGHAWKSFQEHWPDSVRKDLAKNATAHSTFAQCVEHYTLADELKLAQDCCFTHYRGCTDGTGANTCHGPHCPKDPNWWHPNCTIIEEMAAPLSLKRR